MIKKIISLLLGLISYPLVSRIFETTSKNVSGNEGTVMIIFLIVFSLITLGIFYVLKKIFGLLFFIGVIIGIILAFKFF